MATIPLTIYHMNDLHSHFTYWPQIVSYMKKEREKTESYLLLDLGDHADRSHVITEATMGKANVALLNELGIDYATIGNNEGITFSKEALNELYAHASFPVVVANLFDEDGKRPAWATPYVLHTVSEQLTIGMIGVTAPFTPFYRELGWDVRRHEEVLPQLLEEVKGQADVVVLLSHLGLFRDEEIAEQYEGIDLICGAHTHHVLPEGKRLYGTLITQAGRSGKWLGKVELTYDTEARCIAESNAQLIDMEKEAPDQATHLHLEHLNREAKQHLSQEVAYLSQQLTVDWFIPTEGAQLLCDGITEWCGADIGMMNAGVLLESIGPNIVTVGDIHRICPHPINPCLVKMTGDALLETIRRAYTREIIELELKGFGFRGKVLGTMLFTGIDISLSEERDGTLEVTEVKIAGEPVVKEQLYELATLDMYTFGYLFPKIAESQEKRYFMPEMLRDVLAWQLKKIEHR
ncbi:bifunctional UDP-sugar hydrolase/5'-nucleotidase [Halalkalibacterium halodurans]|uniref:bifunctional metallophosphatase/5'-nucleotidase n=1 Tax=Halalkalibacterium halodurans TaxID=86665 RepID=UPI002AAA2640|nr:bifunctional UDP-sugar hydrolase/5'-nucleotidase [Halalkalibacterium halodurans]MDY7223979.1 bifunctional UDP-sugar hydrolase/5'-nucleotidase [Halalkalibacterium halodurans]MDY7243200.1 bifunctional UDP-sugar hydrolase/5'-nucleotidase [Halalkalibacterium halodurans]MED4080139.1 bifunctional UDP-sugar hydrolase/5'-nucleotidase [Halalkalibacterium halodurans]MED4083362.1 bifunctional UDP-sugar hydrolase/5'-nucleotidase [Halalkalibacterium halodurans]MED4105104.1 bifunctional UDP-sugar hydrola